MSINYVSASKLVLLMLAAVEMDVSFLTLVLLRNDEFD